MWSPEQGLGTTVVLDKEILQYQEVKLPTSSLGYLNFFQAKRRNENREVGGLSIKFEADKVEFSINKIQLLIRLKRANRKKVLENTITFSICHKNVLVYVQ